MMGLVCVALKFETSRAQDRSLCFRAKSHMIYCLMLHCDQAAPPPPPPHTHKKVPTLLQTFGVVCFPLRLVCFSFFFSPNDSEGLAERLF